MKKLLFAAQLFTVRELLHNKSREEVYDVLLQIKRMGYQGVQISGIGNVTEETAKLYQEVCQQLDLPIVATHLSLEFLEDQLEWVIAYHKLWNCSYIGIGSMPPSLRDREGVIAFCEKVNKIGRQLRQNDLTLIYHNHKFEFEKFDGKTWMEHFLERFDPEAIEFELDTYWVQAGGCDPVDWIERVNGRMSVIHFKDFRIKNDEQQFAEIGEGNLNWERIIEACENTKVKIVAIEQDGFTTDPLKSLSMSAKYLNLSCS